MSVVCLLLKLIRLCLRQERRQMDLVSTRDVELRRRTLRHKLRDAAHASSHNLYVL